jgi:hypothetical protein
VASRLVSELSCFDSASSKSMQPSEAVSPWWDRADDESGRILRIDVRESAHRVWSVVRAHAKQILGDSGDAPELLETSVRKISLYLDKNNIPLHTTDPSGLLILATYRALRRLARRRGIYHSMETSALSEVLRAPDWREGVDRRLFLEQLGRELDEKTRAVLRLRLSGAGWKEIARAHQMNASAMRQTFWRNIRGAYLRLLRMPASVEHSLKRSKP